jgi:hypothetical protein
MPSRKEGKPVRRGGKSNRADHTFFASLRFYEKKKEKKEYGAPQFFGAGCKDAKPKRPPEVKPSR